ncbi:LacI family DNA-binding transcriptional regulator [Rariglobus hedericola]|nr:LacI family DNA-binding transcriptional regulator [Rariglobus hedericola]
MEDIAKDCGISMMTVSRVISGKGLVSAATREKVLEAVKRLDFQINTVASNLARSRSGFIGIALPFHGLIGSDYFGEIVRGVQSVLMDTEWDISLFDIRARTFEDGAKLQQLHRTRKVDGLLVIAPNAHEAFLETFSSMRLPLVVVGKRVDHRGVCCVSCDDYQGIESMCEHLHGLGHRRIAFVGGPAGFSVAHAREQAFLDFCARKRLSKKSRPLWRGDYSFKSGCDAGLALLQTEERPTAIIAANDAMAHGLIEATRELRLTVPRDVSIGGFDDLPSSENIHPALTTVHQPVFEMAAHGARLLVEALNKQVRPEGRSLLKVRLIVRQSTGSIA